MICRLFSSAACITFLAGVLCSALCAATEIPFQVGQPFPGLELPSIEDGRATSVNEYRGRKLVLHVWASW